MEAIDFLGHNEFVFNIDQWRASHQEGLTVDLTQAASQFSFPHTPMGAWGSPCFELEKLRRAELGDHHEGVAITAAPRVEDLVTALFEQNGLALNAKLAVRPPRIAIIDGALRPEIYIRLPTKPVISLDRDSDSWPDTGDPSITHVLVSNPVYRDGMIYPPEIFSKHIIKLRLLFANALIVVDESLGVLSFSEVKAGSARPLTSHDKNLIVINSLAPIMEPRAPLAWALGPPLLGIPEPSDAVLLKGIDLRLQFIFLQGKAAAELQRRLHWVRQTLELWSTVLSRGIAEKKIHVPHWPDAGSYLSFQLLNSQKWPSDRDFCEELFRRSGVLCTPGSLFGCPNFVQICFLQGVKLQRKAAPALEECLLL